jgi:hypothetical protein
MSGGVLKHPQRAWVAGAAAEGKPPQFGSRWPRKDQRLESFAPLHRPAEGVAYCAS